MMIEKDIDMNELQNICLLIAQNLTNNKDEVCLKTEKSQVYVNYNDKNTGISIVGIKKNAKESYIKSYLLASSTLDIDVSISAPGFNTKSTCSSCNFCINASLSSSNLASFKCACESNNIVFTP